MSLPFELALDAELFPDAIGLLSQELQRPVSVVDFLGQISQRIRMRLKRSRRLVERRRIDDHRGHLSRRCALWRRSLPLQYSEPSSPDDRAQRGTKGEQSRKRQVSYLLFHS